MSVAIDPSVTLAELERLSLDYCCGGQRTLAEACAGLGILGSARSTEARA